MRSSDSRSGGPGAGWDVRALAGENEAFRREIMTGRTAQLVVMTIPPGGEIGEEVHPDTDQILLFVEGEGEAVLEGRVSPVGPDRIVLVSAGTRHNFKNTGEGPMRLLTVYAPPEHPPGTVHLTKAEAKAAEGH